MLERHFTAERINEIVNHPSILPWVKGKHDALDLKNVAANTNNVCLVGEHGCVIFIKHHVGMYEFHTSVLPEGRGRWMLEGAKFAFEWMFTHTDAYELMTKCPDGNLASKAGARAVGCKKQFRTGPIWPVGDEMVPVDVWSISLPEWASHVDGMVEKGHLFHELLNSKTPHDDDEVHDRYVGITSEMVRAGQPVKAVYFYNRWAALSGYALIKIESLEPLIIDIRESRLKITNNNFEVLPCRQAV
jgi:hypothetical protein